MQVYKQGPTCPFRLTIAATIDTPGYGTMTLCKAYNNKPKVVADFSITITKNEPQTQKLVILSQESSQETNKRGEEIPEREATDAIAQFLSLVMFLIASTFSDNMSVPVSRTPFFPHNNACSHA